MPDSSALKLQRRCRCFPMLHVLLGLSMLANSWTGPSLPAIAAPPKASPAPRSVTLQEIRGTVTYKGARVRPARVGDRLVTGQGVTTGKKSSAIVALDSQLGTIKVSESTDFMIRKLDRANGGSITLISVERGQVALRVRPFTNPASRLEIRTPSGVSGVRGTEFGVAVSPSGRSAILTVEGKVAVSAQKQAVLVSQGYSSLVYAGEAPTPPRPTVENVDLTIVSLRRYRSRLLRLEGRVDPINAVFYDDQPIELRRDGTFSVEVLGSQDSSLTFLVRTPLGREKEYRVWFP
jgi:FecR protein